MPIPKLLSAAGTSKPLRTVCAVSK